MIGCTLVEPGGEHTDFRNRNARVADTLAAYDASPSGWSTGSSPDTTRPSPGQRRPGAYTQVDRTRQRRLAGHARPALRPTGAAGSATRARLLDLLNRARDA
jgi:hypothetical protein